LHTAKAGIRILPAAFTDHCAVALRVKIPTSRIGRPRGEWKLYPSTVADHVIRHLIQEHWAAWRRLRSYYRDVGHWWTQCVQRKVRRVVGAEMVSRKANFRAMEHLYYQCIHDVLNGARPPAEKNLQLKKYKALLVRLKARYAAGPLWM
jgi:hypothetical protein